MRRFAGCLGLLQSMPCGMIAAEKIFEAAGNAA